MKPLRVGDLLYGYCGGEFGGDVEYEKTVEAIGTDWVVARDIDGTPVFAWCDPEELVSHVVPRD